MQLSPQNFKIMKIIISNNEKIFFSIYKTKQNLEGRTLNCFHVNITITDPKMKVELFVLMFYTLHLNIL